MGREWDQSDPRLYPPYLLEHRDFGLHQAIAVGRVIEAILNGQRRILLAMTIGTGRSWVLFQVAWKLVHSRYYRRILYLTELVLLREQAEKRFKALDQNLLILSKTHPAHASAHVHMATVSQLYIEETYNSLLSLPSDFYDLIILEDIRYEKGLLPILDHFSIATRIALDNIGTSTIPRDYTPVFTYTGHDVFETEYAQPPAGFLATRLMDIAEIRVGKRYKKSSSGANNTSGPSTCYLITPSNIQADGSLQPDAKSIIERVDLDAQKYFIEDRGARRAYNGYSTAGRIGFISAVLQVAGQNGGQDLFIPELVELTSMLDLTRHLQDDFRNHLSHTTTAHEGIAERTLKTFKPAIEQLLEQLAFLTRYPLVRIPSFAVRQGRWVRRMVVYKGVVPRSEEESLSVSSVFPTAESEHLVLLGGEDKVLDLYPLYQLLANEETHFETHLCFLKQRKHGERGLEGESIQGAFEIQLGGFDEFEGLQQKILDNPGGR